MSTSRGLGCLLFDPNLVAAPVGRTPAELQGVFQTLRVIDSTGASSWGSQARWPKKPDISEPAAQNQDYWMYAASAPTGEAFDATTNVLSIPLAASDSGTLASWDLSNAQIEIFPLSYSVYNLPVWQLGGGNTLDVLNRPYGATSGPDGMRFAVSNIPDVVSAPHEWSIDRSAARVSFERGSSGETVVLSWLTELLSIAGTAATPVHDVVVQGVEFADTAYSANDYLPELTEDFAVDVSYATSVTFKDCVFESPWDAISP